MIKDAILSQQPSVDIAWSSLDRPLDSSCIRKTIISHHTLWIIISKKIWSNGQTLVKKAREVLCVREPLQYFM